MEMSTGTVFLVGAGPGDPDLITVKGLVELLLASDAFIRLGSPVVRANW